MHHDSTDLYRSGELGKQNSEWSLAYAPGKALDLMPGYRAIAAARGTGPLSIADVGAGAGGVVVELCNKIRAENPAQPVTACGFEIAPLAVQLAKERFPDLPIKEKLFDDGDGPFDVVLFVDVLEHLENPTALLRTAAKTSQYMLVRQPLLESAASFFKNDYPNQRRDWGHIAYFNYRSFLDMAGAAGWEPLAVSLVAPWELNGIVATGGSTVKRLITGRHRLAASYLFSGFYLNGAFRRRSQPAGRSDGRDQPAEAMVVTSRPKRWIVFTWPWPWPWPWPKIEVHRL